jgi:hypothetical protein
MTPAQARIDATCRDKPLDLTTQNIAQLINAVIHDERNMIISAHVLLLKNLIDRLQAAEVVK